MRARGLYRFQGLFGLTDEQAMWRVREQDDLRAFEQLVQRWERPVWDLCTRMTGDPHRGEDLKQETFLRVFGKRRSYQPSARFSSWLWRIALNLCYDELRRFKRRNECPLEDLHIMSYILERNLLDLLGHPRPEYRMGIPMLLNPDSQNLSSTYLEGFGALFQAQVNFPLVAPPSTDEKGEEDQAANTERERAKDELYGPSRGRYPRGGGLGGGAFGGGGGGGLGGGAGGYGAYRRYGMGSQVPVYANHSAIGYDSNRVEKLTVAVLESLKNAANIRNLDENDYVAVIVKGSDLPRQAAGREGGYDDPYYLEDELSRAAQPGGLGASGKTQTTLSIRASKSSIVAFAQGDIDLDQFREQASVQTYRASKNVSKP